MYLLLIFIFLKTGAVEARTSIVYNMYEETRGVCQDSLPLEIKLYKQGKFEDGPKPELIRKVTGRCEPVDNEKFARG